MTERNPHRIIYVGPQDCALRVTLEILAKARACVPDLELRICRTTTVAESPDDNPQRVYAYRKMNAEIESMIKRYGVQEFAERDLEDELQQAAIWCHPTHHSDMSAIAARLAQQHGAIPVYSPVDYFAPQIFAGVPVCGIPALDRLVMCRFAYEIVRLANSAELQEHIRVPMMERAAQMKWEVPIHKLRYILRRAAKIQGWMSEAESIWLAEAAARSESVVEIGCWKGRTTGTLAMSCPGVVHAVDHWKGAVDQFQPQFVIDEIAGGKLYDTFLRNINDFSNVVVHKMGSLEAAPAIESADLIFIDGGHGEAEVRADIRAWLPKARKIIAGHDYDWPSVQAGVAAELGEVQKGPGAIWFKILDKEESLSNAAD